MGVFNFVAKELARQLIEDNSGRKVKVLEHGVCLILDSQLKGVVVKTSDGTYFTARADSNARNGWCVEIDTNTVAKNSENPNGYFTANYRVITRKTMGGFYTGSHDVGDWREGLTFVPRTAKVKGWFEEWCLSQDSI